MQQHVSFIAEHPGVVVTLVVQLAGILFGAGVLWQKVNHLAENQKQLRKQVRQLDRRQSVDDDDNNEP